MCVVCVESTLCLMLSHMVSKMEVGKGVLVVWYLSGLFQLFMLCLFRLAFVCMVSSYRVTYHSLGQPIRVCPTKQKQNAYNYLC